MFAELINANALIQAVCSCVMFKVIHFPSERFRVTDHEKKGLPNLPFRKGHKKGQHR